MGSDEASALWAVFRGASLGVVPHTDLVGSWRDVLRDTLAG
jgi:hypothetical protein